MRAWMAFPFVIAGCGEIIGIHDVPDPSGDGSPGIETGLPDGMTMSDGNGDGGMTDTGIDADPGDGGPCMVDAGTCNDLMIVPAGWTPVVLSTTNLSCPLGFSGSNVHVDPVAMSGACTCSASNQNPPTCVNGNVTRSNGTSCVNGQGQIAVNGQCNVVGGTIDIGEKDSTVGPGGSCTSTATANPNKLSDTPASVCTPVQCPNDVCAGMAPAGHIACIQTTGDVACPSTGPFKNQRLVGDMMTLDCSAACTTCAANATCTSASIAFYSDTACQNPVTSVAADSSCHSTGLSNTAFGSVKYFATPQNITYTAMGPGTAKITRSNAKTLCCK